MRVAFDVSYRRVPTTITAVLTLHIPCVQGQTITPSLICPQIRVFNQYLLPTWGEYYSTMNTRSAEITFTEASDTENAPWDIVNKKVDAYIEDSIAKLRLAYSMNRVPKVRYITVDLAGLEVIVEEQKPSTGYQETAEEPPLTVQEESSVHAVKKILSLRRLPCREGAIWFLLHLGEIKHTGAQLEESGWDNLSLTGRYLATIHNLARATDVDENDKVLWLKWLYEDFC